jgi:benzylsuccinate CoA-transferase BbsE subunit
MANDYLNSMDWDSLDMFKADQAEVDCISQPIEIFFRARTKNEISQGATKRNISICPLSSMADLYDDEQLRFRDLWTEVEYPETGLNLICPKGFLQSSVFEQDIRRRAPFAGEHNAEVYGSLGLAGTEIERLKETGVI